MVTWELEIWQVVFIVAYMTIAQCTILRKLYELIITHFTDKPEDD